jgi:hypothetical protein
MKNLFSFLHFLNSGLANPGRQHSSTSLREHVDLKLSAKQNQKLFQKSHLDPAQANVLRDSFLSDPLRFKAFIGSLLPNNNLKYAGAGAFGMIFKADGELKLDHEFQRSDFTGSLPPAGTSTVLKITTHYDEAQRIKKFISEQGGSAPGVVRYYWIKEFQMPVDLAWSKLLGPPKTGEMTKRDRLEKNKLHTSQWLQQEFPNLSGRDLAQKTERTFKKWTEFNKNKKITKSTKIWVVCLEEVKVPPSEFKELLNFGFDWFYHCQKEGSSSKRGETHRGVKPISVIKNVYLADKNLRRYYDNLAVPHEESLSMHPTYEEFKKVCQLVTNLISRVWQGSDKPQSYDLHPGNVGLSNNQLVAFDLWS